MKSIKNHFMFILPLVAILLSIAAIIIFNRLTHTYEQTLKEGYSILVVSKTPVKLSDLQELSSEITSLEPLDRDKIVAQTIEGIEGSAKKEILKHLPYFYKVRLREFVDLEMLDELKARLSKAKGVQRVETFGKSYEEKYKLFVFIKVLINLFVVLIATVSFFLIVKQMQIWRYEHAQRMHVMEIFGASLFLRSGVLFKVAVIDAIIAALLSSALLWYLKNYWIEQSGISFLRQKSAELFTTQDFLTLLFVALLIVILAVIIVISSINAEEEV